MKEAIMLKNHPRALELGINTDISAFSVTNNQLFDSIAELVDLETVTNHELREIFFIVRKRLAHLNWKELVAYSIEHLPFGLNQTQLAWEGQHPVKAVRTPCSKRKAVITKTNAKPGKSLKPSCENEKGCTCDAAFPLLIL